MNANDQLVLRTNQICWQRRESAVSRFTLIPFMRHTGNFTGKRLLIPPAILLAVMLLLILPAAWMDVGYHQNESSAPSIAIYFAWATPLSSPVFLLFLWIWRDEDSFGRYLLAFLVWVCALAFSLMYVGFLNRALDKSPAEVIEATVVSKYIEHYIPRRSRTRKKRHYLKVTRPDGSRLENHLYVDEEIFHNLNVDPPKNKIIVLRKKGRLGVPFFSEVRLPAID